MPVALVAALGIAVLFPGGCADSGSDSGSSVAPDTVIDLSHDGEGRGIGFGDTTDPVYAYQTFVANQHPNIDKIRVKISRARGATGQGDIVAGLYATNTRTNAPIGAPLAIAIAPESLVPEPQAAQAIDISLTYSGLVDGRQYAIVLGQTPQSSSDGPIYIWLVGGTARGSATSKNHFGTLKTNFGATPRDSWADGWLQVYVSD